MKPTLRNIAATLVCAAVVVTLGTHLINRFNTDSDPTVELRQSVILPSSLFLKPGKSIEFYESAIRQAPYVVSNHLALAQAHMQQADRSGLEFVHIPAAEKALKTALSLDSDNIHGLVLQARLYNKLHRFGDGLVQSERILAQSPSSIAGLQSKIDALIELGRLDEAIVATDELLGYKPGLSAFSRASYLRELLGDSDGAIAVMELAAEAGSAGSTERSWVLYQLAKLQVAKGNLEHAEQIIDGLLEEDREFDRAQAVLAHIDVLNGNFDAAQSRLEDALERAPRPQFLDGLLEVYTMQGNTNGVNEMLNRLDDSFKSAQKMGEIVNMEYADFLSDHSMNLDQALSMAQTDFDRRPGHRHARETLAWTLHANGMSAKALDIIEPLTSDPRGDAKLLYRAGLISMGANRMLEGRELLKTALDLNLELESPAAALHADTVLNG